MSTRSTVVINDWVKDILEVGRRANLQNVYSCVGIMLPQQALQVELRVVGVGIRCFEMIQSAAATAQHRLQYQLGHRIVDRPLPAI